MITAEQIAHFQTFGFLALKQAFSSNEMAEIVRVFDNLLEKDQQGKPALDEKQQSRYHRLQSVYGIAERHPTLTGLVADDRIYETVCQLLGDGCRWPSAPKDTIILGIQDGIQMAAAPKTIFLSRFHCIWIHSPKIPAACA